MTVVVDKHAVRDLKRILFEDLETWTTNEYDGHRLDLHALTFADRKYIITIAYECYIQGCKDAVEQINRDHERQRRQAQKRAEDRLLKGYEKYLREKGK